MGAKKQRKNKKITVVGTETPEENDPFAQIGQTEVEDVDPPAEVSGTTIPVEFETPSIHMEDEGEDVFDSLGSQMKATEPESAGIGERPEVRDTSEPIQLVEDAANDLFDTLGVEHYDPKTDHIEPDHVLRSGEEVEESTLPAVDTAETLGISTEDTSTVLEDRQEATEESHSPLKPATTLDMDSTAKAPITSESKPVASDVFDTIDTSDPIDQPTETPSNSVSTPTAAELDDGGIEIEDNGDRDDVFATLASGEDVQEGGKAEQPEEASPTAQPTTSGIQLVETEHDSIFDNIGSASNETEGPAESGDVSVEQEDDVFANLGSGQEVQEAESTYQPEEISSAAQPTTSAIELIKTEHDSVFDNLGAMDDVQESMQAETNPSAAQPTASAIELVETEHDSIFDNLGSATDEPEGPAGSGDSLEEQERKYQLLLEEFGGEEQEFLPETDPTHQAAAFFGEEESTPFDEFTPASEPEPEYMQTASSSTTPPPNLSIENSLQDIEPYEGDTSMVSDTSDWLREDTNGDQSFSVKDSATLGGSSSPVDFEVPYGWYEGDTFHYYTDEQREQVRLAMLETQPKPAESVSQSQGKFPPSISKVKLTCQTTRAHPCKRRHRPFQRTQHGVHQIPISTVIRMALLPPGCPLHHRLARTLANPNIPPVQQIRILTRRYHPKPLPPSLTTLMLLRHQLPRLTIPTQKFNLPNSQSTMVIKRNLVHSQNPHPLHVPLHLRG
jgi:hypothetical protein